MLQWISAHEHLLVACQLFGVMLALGASLEIDEFSRLAKRPMPFVLGLAGIWLFVPGLFALGIWMFPVEPSIALGLAILVGMPGGPMSALFTKFARGNTALAVALTACTTLASVVVTPVILSVLLRLLRFGGEAQITLPAGRLLLECTLFLFLPLIVGITVRQLLPGQRRRIEIWGVRIGSALLTAYIAGALLGGRIQPLRYGWPVAVGIVVFCVLSQQLVMLPYRLLGFPAADRLAAGMETTIRDLNLALLVKVILLPMELTAAVDDGALYAILFYGGTSLVVATLTTFIFRRFFATADNLAKAVAAGRWEK